MAGQPTPPQRTPLRNKGWIGPYWGKPNVNETLIRPYFSGEVPLGGGMVDQPSWNLIEFPSSLSATEISQDLRGTLVQGCRFGPESKQNSGNQYLVPAWCHLWLIVSENVWGTNLQTLKMDHRPPKFKSMRGSHAQPVQFLLHILSSVYIQ